MNEKRFLVPVVGIDDNFVSVFKQRQFDKHARGGMLLSYQIGAKNFRIRESAPGYTTNWHLSGDATLIVVQEGILRITLQSGLFKDFKAGDIFIAEDKLPEGLVFDHSVHGHKAEVLGSSTFRAIHIKLHVL